MRILELNRWTPAASLLAIATGGLSSPALAQLEEITVTARKVEETLQEAPLSVSAFTAETLENARIRDIDDLSNFTANLTFEAGEAGRRQTPVIRGLGVIDGRGFDNNVGVFVDGVFISGRASQNTRMLDLERVEVVRGPQSALYGRNTFAGAINYVTRKPNEEFMGEVSVDAAEDGLLEVIGSVSGPIAGETLSGLISFDYLDDDGQLENRNSSNIGGAENKSVYGALRWQPSDAVDINLNGYYSDEFLESRGLNRVENNCGELTSSLTTPFYDQGVPAYYCGEVPAASSNTYNLSPDAYSFDGETWRVSLDMKFDLGNMELASISSYSQNENLQKLDLDRSQEGEPFYGSVPLADYQAGGSPPFFFLGAPPFTNFDISNMNTYLGAVGLDQEYFSQEFRLTSTTDGPFRWVAGLYYFDQENIDSTTLAVNATPAIDALGLPPDQIQFLLVSPTPIGTGALPTPIIPNVAFRPDSNEQTLVLADTSATQYAVFGSAEYDFTDKLTGTVELRYTYEERELENTFDIFFFTPNTRYKDDWSFWDPRFILRYQQSESLMFYGSASSGSRSGGLNVAITDPALVPFDEETNWTYELGVKSEWFDNQLQMNASVFYIDWEDAQFRQRLPSSASGTGFLTATTNATGLTNYGFELELIAALGEGVTAGAALGYANPEYDSGSVSSGDAPLCGFQDASTSAFPTLPLNCTGIDSDGDGVIDAQAPDISGLRPIRTSKHTGSLFLQAMRPLTANLDWMGRLDVGYRSEQPTDNVNVQFAPSRTLVNTRLGVVSEKFDVILWVENLFDEDAIETTQTFNSDLNSFRYVTTGVAINPRRLGVTGRYRF